MLLVWKWGIKSSLGRQFDGDADQPVSTYPTLLRDSVLRTEYIISLCKQLPSALNVRELTLAVLLPFSCSDLSGISAQLDKPGVKKISQILELAKSSYTAPFTKLAGQIKVSTEGITPNWRKSSYLELFTLDGFEAMGKQLQIKDRFIIFKARPADVISM